MGCAGARWIGAVVSTRGEPRSDAHLWRELLEWAAQLPHGDEIVAELVDPTEAVSVARAATGMHPFAAGLLGVLGLTPGQVGTAGAPFGTTTLGAHELKLSDAERALVAAAVPFRRTPRATKTVMALQPNDDPRSFAMRAAAECSAVVLDGRATAGAALVRAVRASPGSVHVIVLSQRHNAATVSFPDQSRELAPGEATTFARAELTAARRHSQRPKSKPSVSAARAKMMSGETRFRGLRRRELASPGDDCLPWLASRAPL